MKPFCITDLGAPVTFTRDPPGPPPVETLVIGRYGVWAKRRDGKAEVITTGHDLEELQREHGPGLPVYLMAAGSMGRFGPPPSPAP